MKKVPRNGEEMSVVACSPLATMSKGGLTSLKTAAGVTMTGERVL